MANSRPNVGPRECSAKKRGHKDAITEAACPKCGSSSRARRNSTVAAMPKSNAAPPANNKRTVINESRRVRDKRIVGVDAAGGTLSIVGPDGYAEDCSSYQQMKVESGALAKECHARTGLKVMHDSRVEDCSAGGYIFLSDESSGEGCEAPNITIRMNASIANSHASQTFDIDDGAEVTGCTAGSAFVISRGEPTLTITEPNQVVIVQEGANPKLSYPKDSTIVIRPTRQSPPPFNNSFTAQETLVALSRFFKRPKDGSRGAWLSPDNEAAMLAYLEYGGTLRDTKTNDSIMEIALVTHENP